MITTETAGGEENCGGGGGERMKVKGEEIRGGEGGTGRVSGVGAASLLAQRSTFNVWQSIWEIQVSHMHDSCLVNFNVSCQKVQFAIKR